MAAGPEGSPAVRSGPCAMSRILPAIVAVIHLAIGGGAWGQVEPATVEEIAADVDMRSSGWEGERLAAEVGGILGGFAKAWSAGDRKAALARLDPSGKAVATSLSPPLRRRTLAGGIEVGRPAGPLPEEEQGPLDRAVARWLQPFAGASLGIKSKVVGVDPGEVSASTLLRIELLARSAGGRTQQIAEWRAFWTKPNEGDPELIAIVLVDFHEVRSGEFLADATASLLADGDPVLSRGGDYWLDKIDQVGESPLMGHHGIAVGDVNGDGLEDVYVACPTGIPNRLLIRNADGTFTDRAHAAGVAWLDDTKGVLLADMNNNGRLDLWCAIGNALVLCVNKGDGTFGPFISVRAATPSAFYGLSAADFDLDGDLDLYAARYVESAYGTSIPMPLHDANNGPSNILLRNDGNWKFTDVTRQSGLDANNRRFSLIGVWEDVTGNGYPDLYVTNDFGRNNFYRNEGGRFVDAAAEAGVEDQAAGMGATFGDVDGDGLPDLYVTNMFSSAGRRIAPRERFQPEASGEARAAIHRHSLGNSMFRNLGGGRFREIGDEAGVRMGRWGWGALFVDLNLDGLLDIYAPNGFVTGALDDDL